MTFQIFTVIYILGIALICDVMGASYSNVYVEREVVPMRYYQYGTPYPSIANPRLSQINTLPSLQGYVTPCVSPCVYPTQTAATVASVNPNQNVITYNSPAPSVPIVVAPTKEEVIPYEYSYVVYDENTGDHKAQRELSDGSVVRGEYSFLQPDGYVREVQYVADDISGFNAVVKNFLPVAVDGKRKNEAQEKIESSPPCHEIKNESLKEESGDSAKILNANEENSREIHQKVSKESGKDSDEKIKEKQHIEPKNLKEESEEKSKETHAIKSNEKESKEESTQVSVSEESKEDLKEKSRKKTGEENQMKSKKGSKQAADENSGEVSVVTSHGKHKEADELLKPTDEVLVSYKDVIRCIEAAMKRNYGVPAAMRQGPSPLAYIVLNKPC